MRALGLVFALLACQRMARSSPPPEATRPPLIQVVVVSGAGRTAIQAEVAKDDAERARGLMFRRSLGPNQGMIFFFSETSEHRFWMKNTLIPLDMIFIGPDHRIVGIVENAEPRTLTSRDPGALSRYVLEVAGGTAFAHGWRKGDRIEFEEPDGVR
ncbi:MAG: DUF192 domain-containing protein [Deltaproteobacteria bacterium]